MAKIKTAYQCNDCGTQVNKWAGQCPDCKAWNTLAEITLEASSATIKNRYSGFTGFADKVEVTDLASIKLDDNIRLLTGIGELDRVLGGGVVPGSVTLIGGDPGIGKSTLLLQVLSGLAEKVPSLYITGEESLQQVSMRAHRLGLVTEKLRCVTETCVEKIIDIAEREKPGFMVIDSIQTVFSEQLQSAPGAVAQVRESAARLVRYAKSRGVAMVLVGHVTKDGSLAGPRVLEHMVDAVLYFESDSGSRYRVIRAIKNRFGAVNELGVFAMTELGLREVSNPSALFLSGQPEETSGSAVMVTREGTRPLLVEVQALVDASRLANPRRVAVGVDGNRLAMLLAVLHRHAGLSLGDQDVFINVVGGMRISETASDLPMALALYSSLSDRPLGKRMVSFGEVGLSGEIRPVYNGEDRLKEAATHGYKTALIPRANAPKKPMKGLKIIPVGNISEAMRLVREQ
ncbi:MAG: DNA repair protein RadA [Xanthomonadales bacterium]|nr:DNA repair protein RadA [Xanthomonadales bacterium]